MPSIQMCPWGTVLPNPIATGQMFPLQWKLQFEVVPQWHATHALVAATGDSADTWHLWHGRALCRWCYLRKLCMWWAAANRVWRTRDTLNAGLCTSYMLTLRVLSLWITGVLKKFWKISAWKITFLIEAHRWYLLKRPELCWRFPVVITFKNSFFIFNIYKSQLIQED